ncbi:MAG TPA: NADP-dependent oxidoreductase [Candidatus Polarisedimenticolaceae bacterium]|nr:NADP-dependent oxidoreductase [Candidatus Polarisedimenticolaceae bacterium]
MRAIALDQFGGPERLKLVELPRPRPGPDELLIHVVAAGVNPVDWKIREGLLQEVLPHGFPLIPGWDAAGAVEEFGGGVSGFRRGERVYTYARKAEVRWGCYAEYVAVPAANVARMPAKLLFEEAAAVPLAALTAQQALFGAVAPGPGRSVLIHAAAGGVGHFAVQLAKAAGAWVAGTAGRANHPFLLSLGADAAIDTAETDLGAELRRLLPAGFDLVLDAVGGTTLATSYAATKPGGRVVSIVDRPDAGAAAARGITAEFLFVRPSGEQLAQLAAALDRQQLRVEVQKIYPLAAAAQAQEVSRAGHVRGKLVLGI